MEAFNVFKGRVVGVPYLVARIEQLKEALIGLSSKSHDGPCWCEMAGNHPLVHSHSAACLAARKALKEG